MNSWNVPAGRVFLKGDLTAPKGATGIVIFAHGSGSSRFSPRNRFVARELAKAGLATFLADLLTEEEERVDAITSELRFDIPLLASRLAGVSDYLLTQKATRTLRQGYFGASTGAAAALITAARRPAGVFAVVSRGGRPDLAEQELPRVRAPTLLIVGGDDTEVIALNRKAAASLRCETRLEIVPGATHLFEESGTLETVARLAADWFGRHLARRSKLMFKDRADAAAQLAKHLQAYKDDKDAVVVAIPRGGVAIGAVLARELRLPLDAILTKKIGHPLEPEFAIGVVNLTHEMIDEGVVARDHIRPEYIRGEIARIRKLLRRRYESYRGGRPPLPLKGKTVILADDGIATGNSMAAAIRLARDEGAKKIVVAVPVGPSDSLQKLRRSADEVVCALVPDVFMAIGQFYDDFEQVDDEEAIRLLKETVPPAARR